MRRPSLLLLGLLAFAATGCCLNVSGGRSSCLSSSSSWPSKSHSESCHCGARKSGKTSLFSGFGRSKQASLPSRPGPLFAGDSWGSHPFSGMNSCVECGGCGEPAMPIMTGCGECSSCAPMPDCSSPMVTGCHAPSCAQPVMQPDCHAPTCAQPFVQPDCHAPTCAQPMVAPDCHAPHIMIGPGPDCSGPLAVPSCVAPQMPGCAMPAPAPVPQPHNHAAPVPPEYAPPPAPVPPSTELTPAPVPSPVPAPTPAPAGEAVPMPVNDLPPAGTPVDPVSWEVPAFPPIK